MLMYRPSEAAQMTTAMRLQLPTINTEYGVSTKVWRDSSLVIQCNFKSYGGTERINNDMLTVEDTAQIVCWFHPDIKSECRLVRLSDNAVFEILGEPENIEMRNQFLKFKIRRVKGGA
jgi:head-tail adaptor